VPNPVAHFEIMGKDAIELQKFYADVFAWKLGPPAADMGDYSLLDNEGEGIAGGIGEGDPGVTVYIEVDDPQAYLDKVVLAGGKITMPVTPIMDTVTIAMFADPAGNSVGLVKSS
jgi:uncharacterized protein